MDLLVRNIVWRSHALYVVSARLLNIFTEISTQVLNLLDFQVQAQCSANIDAEASEERLPEGVFLDSLLIQAISQEFKAQVLLEAAIATPELPVLKSRAQVLLLLIGGDTLRQ